MDYRIIVHTDGRVEHQIPIGLLDQFRKECIQLFNSYDIIETHGENQKCIALSAMKAQSKRISPLIVVEEPQNLKINCSLIANSFFCIFGIKSKYYGKVYPEGKAYPEANNEEWCLRFILYLRNQLTNNSIEPIISASDLYVSYKDWCDMNQEKQVTNTMFGTQIAKYIDKKKSSENIYNLNPLKKKKKKILKKYTI